ncbi:MAG: formate dehydrogenase accessory sulfurtransferase FdhD, partial [Armatimonadetes bacterium]|nr:formate dehydrogenase accessory sulfurtransferase FdhD [Armatimonadota bacterium]
MRNARRSTGEAEVVKVRAGRVARRRDLVAAEEPMEIRLHHAGEEEGRSVAITMRTPGQDFALAAGFLFAEGIIAGREDIARITYCIDEPQDYNVISVYLRPGVVFDPSRLMRHFYATSSCGVCGKASLEALEVRGCAPLPDGPAVSEGVLNRLPEILRR